MGKKGRLAAAAVQGFASTFTPAFQRSYAASREIAVERQQRQVAADAMADLQKQLQPSFNREALAAKGYQDLLDRMAAGEKVSQAQLKGALNRYMQTPVVEAGKRIQMYMGADANSGGNPFFKEMAVELINADKSRIDQHMRGMQTMHEGVVRQSITQTEQAGAGERLETQIGAKAREGEKGRTFENEQRRLEGNRLSWEAGQERQNRLDVVQLRNDLMAGREAASRADEDMLSKGEFVVAAETAHSKATEAWSRVEPDERAQMLEALNVDGGNFRKSELEDQWIRDTSRQFLIDFRVIEELEEGGPTGDIGAPDDPNLDPSMEAPGPSAAFQQGQAARQKIGQTASESLPWLGGPAVGLTTNFIQSFTGEESKAWSDYFSGLTSKAPKPQPKPSRSSKE